MNVAAPLRAKDYAALEKELAACRLDDLARAWAPMNAMDKLVAFHLLDAPRALELYEKLPFDEKYFLLGGFSLQSIAPILETTKHRFVPLPRDYYDRMFRGLTR